jgi:hypothetical protein
LAPHAAPYQDAAPPGRPVRGAGILAIAGSRVARLLSQTAVRLHLLDADAPGDPVLPFSADELAQGGGAVPVYVRQELEALQESGAVSLGRDGVRIRYATRAT